MTTTPNLTLAREALMEAREWIVHADHCHTQTQIKGPCDCGATYAGKLVADAIASIAADAAPASQRVPVDVIVRRGKTGTTADPVCEQRDGKVIVPADPRCKCTFTNGGQSTPVDCPVHYHAFGPSAVGADDAPAGEPAPIDMVLWCPRCGLQHVDAPEPNLMNWGGERDSVLHGMKDGIPRPVWTNPPHKSHLCHGCGLIWRQASVPTNGVESVPAGKADSWRSDSSRFAPLASPSTPQQRGDTAWLIERGPNQHQLPHVWFTVHDGWSEDANKAMRFATKELAEEHATRKLWRKPVYEKLWGKGYAVTEHAWIGDKPEQQRGEFGMSAHTVITDMLRAADALWEEKECGHDWAAACRQARKFLRDIAARPAEPARGMPDGVRRVVESIRRYNNAGLRFDKWADQIEAAYAEGEKG